MSIKHYLDTVKKDVEAGRATEHTHRPALKALLETLDLTINAVNEPKRSDCGAPDYVITRDSLIVGYIEAKDVGKSLAEVERTGQLKRYLGALNNLILTDYLEFRWYVDGALRDTAQLATITTGKIKSRKDGAEAVANLLLAFLNHTPADVNDPHDLATRMARLTHMIRDTIVQAFELGQESNLLQGWRDAFAKVLIADLDRPERTADFADMVAQTLAYGLFSARIMDTTPADFTRTEAQQLIPKSNPFLRKFFSQMTTIELDDEPFAPFVDDLVNLLAHTDMEAVLTDFGRRTRQQDPVVHFYETFLAAYDPKLREARGVYYTPEPVVSYIVRSVDHLLKTRFNCPQGLADSRTITVPNRDPGLTVKGSTKTRKTTENHKVLVLDPATGTGTFLYAVIDHIRQQFMQQGNAGMWPGYVKNHLLPRLFGFELLMAPYAVAHFKLSLQLAGRDLPPELTDAWAYHPETEAERLGIYLTNALEGPHELTGMPLFTQWVADETNAANEVKQNLPVLVVMGNPPYSNFGQMNKGDWILGLLDEYKKGLDEKKLNLDDDFIKFIRFGQWRIEKNGEGILAFITSNTYIDGITHRRMRESLQDTFTDIYILNLHGSSMRYEQSPDGSKDENVFDIRQGVAVGIFIKKGGKASQKANVYYSDLWGSRQTKYNSLLDTDISNTDWIKLAPEKPWWFFVPKEKQSSEEYNTFPSLTSAYQVFGNGIGTDRDGLFYDFDYNILSTRIEKFYSPEALNPPFSEDYKVRDSSSYPLLSRRSATQFSTSCLTNCLYRPFDKRWLYYDPKLISRPASSVMQQFQRSNLALLVTRQISTGEFRHVFISNTISDRDPLSLATRERTQVFPLYLYPTDDAAKQKSLPDAIPPLAGGQRGVWPPDKANGDRIPNLNPEFVKTMEEKLGLVFQPGQTFEVLETSKVFTPEDIFHYIYAIFHSPTYRSRYAEFLKIDFPRAPLTSDVGLFRALCGLGQELVGLHLLESPAVGQLITSYPVAGDNRVEKGYPKYTPPTAQQPGRVHLNKTQYFEGVPPDVWEFQVGGYQVCDKWLKDRRGRQLPYADLTHYQQVVVALQETIRLMQEIDDVIPEWPLP